MSLTSKIVLGTACLTSASIIGYVHYKQKIDRERLHEGVIRDIERQQRRKAENLYNLQRQHDLEKEIKRTEELKGEMSL
ncbi:protein PET117 homolog, mitochondrial [Atheta coriaria]|uniref:protein PET117 homolog, mitochondrial n=1 Tax=Dalotia coriaria TaxID=877792 RepID=UPI0031F416F0